MECVGNRHDNSRQNQDQQSKKTTTVQPVLGSLYQNQSPQSTVNRASDPFNHTVSFKILRRSSK